MEIYNQEFEKRHPSSHKSKAKFSKHLSLPHACYMPQHFPPTPCRLSLSGPNILLGTVLKHPQPGFRVRDQVSHTYKVTRNNVL
jgi:hypothetical protein